MYNSGHQGKGDPKGEPIAPGSNNKRLEFLQVLLELQLKIQSML